jgi:SAM-dependent methyltransferase
VSERAESDYYAFMGFSSESSRDGLRYYLRYFAGAAGPVVELGSGRGEFLDVLAEAGLAGRGVDCDEGMVEQARGRGHDVALADAVDHLAGQPAGSVPALFCAHLLEHLPAERVERLYRHAARALAPGGVFVAAVPNAGCLSVLGYDFWRDPTHVRFYDPMALAFFAERAGLSVTASGGNPNNHPGPPPPLRPPPLAGWPGLGEEIGALVRQAGSRSGGAAPGADNGPVPWPELGHLMATLDQRLQAVQHQLAGLQAAYDNLLTQLYPPNEVYVVARKPDADDPAADDPAANDPAAND